KAGGDGRGAVVPEGGSGGADHRGDRRAGRGRGAARHATARHATARHGERGPGRQPRSPRGAVVRWAGGAQGPHDVAVHSGGGGFGEEGQGGVGLGGRRRMRREGEDLLGGGHESSMIRSEVSGAPGSRSTAARMRSAAASPSTGATRGRT